MILPFFYLKFRLKYLIRPVADDTDIDWFLEILIHDVMYDVLGFLFLEPFRALDPSPLRYMHRSVDVLKKYIVKHGRQDKDDCEEVAV